MRTTAGEGEHNPLILVLLHHSRHCNNHSLPDAQQRTRIAYNFLFARSSRPTLAHSQLLNLLRPAGHCLVAHQLLRCASLCLPGHPCLKALAQYHSHPIVSTFTTHSLLTVKALECAMREVDPSSAGMGRRLIPVIICLSTPGRRSLRRRRRRRLMAWAETVTLDLEPCKGGPRGGLRGTRSLMCDSRLSRKSRNRLATASESLRYQAGALAWSLLCVSTRTSTRCRIRTNSQTRLSQGNSGMAAGVLVGMEVEALEGMAVHLRAYLPKFP